MYMTVLWREEFKPSPEGEYDEEELKRGCSIIKAKSPCHQRLANCSEAVTGDLRIQERGYEAMRNIICDVNSLKESHNAIKCLNLEKMEECARTLMPTSNPQDAGKPPLPTLRCNENPAEIACFDKAFNSSCPLSMETAKAAVTRVDAPGRAAATARYRSRRHPYRTPDDHRTTHGIRIAEHYAESNFQGINRLADYSTNYDFPPGHIPSRAEHRSSKQARSHASTKRPCATSAGSVWI
ncbi:hypothetical protein HPB52_024094 [Rhipicephalus sanguineus]|uniref:Uncharacterized protein n=1 Tax=Rhipicephalus sanguineus TaxID=34632 RepID=A0A9D4QGE6_RHISA|nr:hypothetical protein HPB52_024094 [Rhipicephalus sanguineus]